MGVGHQTGTHHRMTAEEFVTGFLVRQAEYGSGSYPYREQAHTWGCTRLSAVPGKVAQEAQYLKSASERGLGDPGRRGVQ